jgi:hypothetical protein
MFGIERCGIVHTWLKLNFTLGFVIAVDCHECKNFKLSDSDQSVIDMMKHYLHTSRKTECSDNKLSNTFKQINT